MDDKGGCNHGQGRPRQKEQKRMPVFSGTLNPNRRIIMKRKILTVTLAALVTAGAASFSFADIPATGATAEVDSTQTRHYPGGGFKKQRERKHVAIAELLGLSDAQQAQIKDIITAAGQANAPLRQKLAGDRKKIRELSEAAPLDEAALRAAIAADESARTDLAVSRIKVRNRIQAVLTPEQQEKAKQLHLLSPDNRHRWGKPGF